MANEKRLIDANALQLEPDPWGGMNGVIYLGRSGGKTMATVQAMLKRMIDNAPTVDAVEAPDKKMLKAIKILIRQYEHSKRSDYVHNPIAHAFFHTWKQLDESGYGERKGND